MKNPTYGMFTPEGNYMVARIVEAAQKLVADDGDTLNAWQFAYRELEKLSYAEGFEECTDTDVREQVYDVVVGAGVDGPCDFYI